MTEKLLSVIIPAYNLEDYIEECMISICNQTYKNLEIIIVDDGSTDETLDICYKIAARDKRIVVLTQANVGVTTARKNGLSIAKGEYVAFVDGDDWIEPEMYRQLMKFAPSYDLVSSGFVGEDGKCIVDNFTGAYIGHNEMEYIWRTMLYDFEQKKRKNVKGFLWNKVFRTDLIKQVFEDIDNRIFMGEDGNIVWKYLLECKSAYFLDEAYYHHLYREGAASQSKHQNILENVSYKYCDLKKTFDEHCLKEELNAQLQKEIVISTIMAINKFMGFSDEYHIPQFVVDVDDFSAKRLVVYGAGVVGRDVMCRLKNEKTVPIAWMDKNFESLKKRGLDVCSPERIGELEFDVVLIAASTVELAESITADLTKHGIEEEKIVWRKPLRVY